ncbi:hypothetical protein K469DRAFT_697793 [Zopfia rhizophila CBS 207.26]|uniref:DUF676 domain-containing protein n=1 Tax=Zopfia rhizophila CBS 207.26 TaxID=1314779 RepID=A0A6A6EKA0_9PEZI|nr:hypothetical protein K469DRAFT_697793 [Zopfia rhizophila CBS 207.26]
MFVAHSLGGIIVKSALIHSDAARQGALEEHRSIKLSTYGIMFMGTPHQGGSGVAFGKLMANIASVFVAADDRLLQYLDGDFVTKFAFEEYATPTVLGHSIMVVPRASAVVPGAADAEPIVIHADHIHMVKFGSESDTGYETVSGHLRLMTTKAGDVIGLRWDTEGRVNSALMSPSSRSTSNLVHRKCRKSNISLAEVRNSINSIKNLGITALVNSKDVDTLKQGFVAAARRIFRDHPSLVHLKTVTEGGNVDEATDAVKGWLSNSQNNRWLIIYDNYDTLKLPGCNDARAFDIRPFFPEAHQGAIIVTTRSSQLRLGRLIAVKKLQDIEHGLEILSHASGRDGLKDDPNARELARQLDGLPLALATAGAYLYQVSTSFADYIRLYKESWLRLQQKTPQLLSYEDRALYSTWEISLDHVKRQSELAATLLQLWAYFDNEDIWLELLQECQRDGPEWFSEVTRDRLSFDETAYMYQTKKGLSTGL